MRGRRAGYLPCREAPYVLDEVEADRPSGMRSHVLNRMQRRLGSAARRGRYRLWLAPRVLGVARVLGHACLEWAY